MEDNARGEVFSSPKRSRRPILVVAGVTVLAIFIVIFYFSFVRKAGPTAETNSLASEEASKLNYKNLNGFQFKYPKSLKLTENDNGVVLTGNSEMSFVVRPLETPLETIVTKISPDFSIQTQNSRSGYLLAYEGKEHRYFPLYGNYYLEIVFNNLDQTGMDVLSTLEFTPPQASLQ